MFFTSASNLTKSVNDSFLLVHKIEPKKVNTKDNIRKNITFSLFSQLRNTANSKVTKLKRKITRIEKERWSLIITAAPN